VCLARVLERAQVCARRTETERNPGLAPEPLPARGLPRLFLHPHAFSETSMLHSFLRHGWLALALCSLLTACADGSSDAADTGDAVVTVQGVATPKDVAVVTAKNAQ